MPINVFSHIGTSRPQLGWGGVCNLTVFWTDGFPICLSWDINNQLLPPVLSVVNFRPDLVLDWISQMDRGQEKNADDFCEARFLGEASRQ